MKIVVAPDKFKGCLSAPVVAACLEAGLRRIDSTLEIDLCPMADGGEGTVDALVMATGGKLHTRTVIGPLPDMQVQAKLGILGDGQTAVIEMASASGLALLRANQYNPLKTTTYGTGQLLMEAFRLGIKHVILGIGGSATTDGGLGCAQACGVRLILADGQSASGAPALTGGDIVSINGVESGVPPLAGMRITVACDVSNPLVGPTGAAAVFGPQKGATPAQVEELDSALRGLYKRLGQNQAAMAPGAGAAGGLGFGMMAFFGAELKSGIELVTDACRLPQRLQDARLCLTGEGRFDAQSLGGKTAIGVSRLCRQAGVPCIAIAGSVERVGRRGSGGGDGGWKDPAHDAKVLAEGITAVFSICNGPLSLEAAMRDAPDLLADCAENVLRAFSAGSGNRHVDSHATP